MNNAIRINLDGRYNHMIMSENTFGDLEVLFVPEEAEPSVLIGLSDADCNKIADYILARNENKRKKQ